MKLNHLVVTNFFYIDRIIVLNFLCLFSVRWRHIAAFVCCVMALHCCVCLLWGGTTLLCFCCEVTTHCCICFLWGGAFVCKVVVLLAQEVEQHHVAVFVCHDVAPRCWIGLSLSGTALFGKLVMTDSAIQPRDGQESNKSKCSNPRLFMLYTLYFLLVEAVPFLWYT